MIKKIDNDIVEIWQLLDTVSISDLEEELRIAEEKLSSFVKPTYKELEVVVPDGKKEIESSIEYLTKKIEILKK